ncbi:hypothetical protein [Pseudomonas putida]|uniref:hypothetical protein n=1 Tax=Pseudomonas putida TaxID=303 RepID=UPI0023648403|nr:hypothetical protein [Pseudomonas putida]MDD2005086.1 hypothetical protein [Pseudomonas putida]
MNNPRPYNFYVKNSMFERERQEHGEEFFRAVIDIVVNQIAPNPLDSYSRDKLTAKIAGIYNCQKHLNAIKLELGLV